MDAMIFAAGLGTRLRPLTLHRPKALVDIGGMTVLDHVAQRLVAAGADRLVINTHAFPDLLELHVRQRNGYGVTVHLSREPDAPLDTGGGLHQAAPLFRRDASFFLHNCDVISSFDLRALHAAHQHSDAFATLAVRPAGPERYLVFDDAGLCGYAPRDGGSDVLARAPVGTPRRFDFTGIHIARPELLDSLHAGTYSIVMHYIGLARAGARILPHEQPDAQWDDIGTHEKLAEIRARHAHRRAHT